MTFQPNWTNFFAATHSDLRPYQTSILDQVVIGVACGQRKFNVIIPTGAGKSWLIGLMPVKLQRAPALSLCHWQEINASNASFYASEHFHMDGESDAVGRVSTASNHTCLLGQAGIDFAGVRKMLKTPAKISRYALVQIDEIQDVQSAAFETIKANLADDAVLIVYSALPPKAVYDDETFERIEVKLSEVCGFVKVPKILMVNSSGLNDAAWTKVRELATNCAANPTKGKKDAARNALSDFCRSPLLFVRLLRVAMNEYEEMRDGDKGPGILVRCRGVMECRHWKKVVEVLEPGIVAACVTNETLEKEKERIMKKYEEGTIDILFVVKMLSVGWHKSRTSIVMPMGGEAHFSSQLQLFGRAFSASDLFERSVLVLPDVHDDVTRFSRLFPRYMFNGVRALYGAGEVVEVTDDDEEQDVGVDEEFDQA